MDPYEARQAAGDTRDDAEAGRVREAEQAHGGSMAPELVDETGHPVAEPPPSQPTADPRASAMDNGPA
jgi:hypothetical protein